MSDNRELDREIAEKAMGWTLWNYETSEESPNDWTPDKAQNNDGWSCEGREGSHEAYEWSPTTNPAHSKLLREKLLEKDFEVVIRTWHKPELCEVTIERHGMSDPATFTEEASTDELALVLCAIRALKESKS